MNYDKAIEAMRKIENAKKPKMQQWLEKQGYEFNNDGEEIVKLQSSDGKDFGKITRSAYKAIESGTLGSYKPKNDEEATVLSRFRQALTIELKTPDGRSHGKVSYDTYNEISKGNLENYTPKTVDEQQALASFKATVLENAKKERINSDPVFKKYKIDPANFNMMDLDKWAKEHDIPLDISANGGSYNLYGKSDELKKEFNKLQALAQNNYRIESSQQDLGKVAAVMFGGADGLSFGGITYLADKQAERNYKKAGLPTDGYVSGKQMMANTFNEHNISYTAGNIAGSFVSTVAVGAGVEKLLGAGKTALLGTKIGQAAKGVEWVSKASPWIQHAVRDGITFGTTNGVRVAFDGGSTEDILKGVLRGGISGAAGATASMATNVGITKLLTSPKFADKFWVQLKDKVGTNYTRVALSGLADAAGDNLADYAMAKITGTETRSASDVITDFGVTLLFGMTSTALNSKRITKSNKAYIESEVEAYVRDYEALNDAAKKTTSVEGVVELGEGIIARGNKLKEYLQRHIFTGNEELVKSINEKVDYVNGKVREKIDAEVKKADSNAYKSRTSDDFSGRAKSISSTDVMDIKVGDVYKTDDGDTYTITHRDDKNTTYTVTDIDGNTTTISMPNDSVDNIFSYGDVFTKVNDSNPEKFKDIETTTAEESSVVAEPVATEQRNTFTGELDEIASTEMPTVSVGDTFIDTSTNNILKVVGRDESNTTIEITKPSGEKETKTHPNNGADTLAVDDKYKKVETSTATPTENVAVAENTTTTPRVNVGEVYKHKENGTTYTIVSRDNKNTTYTVQYSSGHISTSTADNATADLMFDDDSLQKIQAGNTATAISSDNVVNMGDTVKKEQKKKIVRAKKSDWASHDIYWYAPNTKIVIAYSTRSASDLISTMSEDSPKMTILELHDAINYDEEAKKVLQAYINNGFGDYSASEYFTDNSGNSDNIDTERPEADTQPKENEVVEESIEEKREQIREKAAKTGVINLDELGTLTGIPVTHMSDTAESETTVSKKETVAEEVEENKPDADDVYAVMDGLGLTEEQQSAIMKYKSGESYTLNFLLRAEKELGNHQQRIKDSLNEALQKFPVYNGVVYRNIGFIEKEAFDDFVAEHKEKTSITYPAFTSASKSLDGYVVDAPYLVHYEIEGVNGRDVSQIGITAEKEVLYGTDTTFEFSIIKQTENELFLKMKEVAGDGKSKLETVLEERGKQHSVQESSSESNGRRSDEEVHSTPDAVRGRSTTDDELYKNTSESNSRRIDDSGGTDNTSSIGKTGDASDGERKLSGIETDNNRTTQNDIELTDKCELIATKHTATGNDIWVVTIKDRIPKDEYKELNAKVKSVGGYYSRYAKTPDGKTVPGFVFKSEPSTDAIKVFNDFFGDNEAEETTPVTDVQNTEEVLKNESESATIEENETINKERVENVESQSEVLAGESGNDGRGLHSGTSATDGQETTERNDGQFGENSGESLQQSTGTDGDRPNDRDDGEGVHRGNDAELSESEIGGTSTGDGRGRRGILRGGNGTVSEMGGEYAGLADNADDTPETIETVDKSIEKKRPSNKENFIITDDVATDLDNTLPSAKDNIEAIELLLKLEEEGRPATAEEKKILAKYKGWGGIDIRRLPWELHSKVLGFFEGQQLRDMQNSETNAFFTPTKVIDAMYNGLKRMGFKGGNVLESSMGVGNFFGRMPVAMVAKSALTGVELESYTARIAQYLYPGATVINKPFQDVAIRNGSYDLVIGNVPFGTNKISYNKKKYSLHNYFIISSLDKVKDGGVVAVITSAGTLDSYGLDARKAIMDRADVVACYKLPAGVFSRNASTDVQTDLLILKKRASDAKPSGDSILNVTTTEYGLRLNEYFVKHPENVLGTLAKGTNAWGEITTVLNSGDFYNRLDDAMKKLPQGLISGKVELKPIETIVSTSSKPRFFEKNGKIYADDGAGTATEVTNRVDTVRAYMAVRDAYKDLLDAYAKDMSDEDIKPFRDKLTKAYDHFNKKHTAITGDGKKMMGKSKSRDNRFLKDDADYYLVSGLEKYNKDEKKIEKSELFEKDTLRKKKVESVDSSSEALAVSLNESGRIDFARMQDLTGKTEKQLIDELKGEIVLTPDGDYVLTDIYLSGNIYEKIDAVKDKPEFKEQKEMLEKVLPTPKEASSITVKLGANYIEPKYIEAFSREVFNERISVSKNSSGAWTIEGVRQSRWGDILNVKYGCAKFNAIQLLEKVLNDSDITANKKVKVDGKSVDVFDEEMTQVARQKAEDIKEAFENWIFRDSERRTDIVDKYNRTYNNYRPLDYEHIAEKLSFDSMNETLKKKLYPHQKKGIARFLFGGNILFAHGVGTGKTFEMIASVMEAKRMGIINKTAMVVPNNKVTDFRNDIAEAYPDAKVLVVDSADKKRQTMLGLVNSNDWDIVLIPRTTFTKIPVGAELQQNFINQQIEDFDRQIAEAEYDRNISKRAIDGLKKRRENLTQKLKDLDSDTKRDENSVDFEKLGFDCICVDEAHNYKSITTPTKLNIKGLASGSDAQQANDMLMKLDYMRSMDGRVIFGTGTPITNTVAEIYNMMRMVRPEILEDAGIHSLDEWVNTFANIETITEIGIDNKVKNKSTQIIRKFVNVNEMVGMFRQFADVIFTQDVVKNLPKAKYISIEIDGTDEYRQIEKIISDTIGNATGTEALKAYTKAMALGNAAAVDLKLLSGADSDVNIFKDYSVEELEFENSKINTMCNIAYDEYKASNKIKGTQIIFCDGGAGSGKTYSFNVHNDIKQKLIERGVPENEIVIVKNQNNTQLEELFVKVNSGEVRFLIGTSRKMAEGLNVQKRVVAIHHPTVTYKPSDLEQGDARGVRAGNINEEVKIYRYLQGNTFDSYKWQAIDRKGAMINAALRGENVDELEDIGADDDSDAGVDAATAMAITSGNPLVKEKIDIDKEVKRLKTLKQNYMNEYYRYQDAVAKNPGEIRRLTEYAQRIEDDIALRNKYGDKASIVINGKTFEKQVDANKALFEAIKKAPKNGKFTKIGEYNGFDIMFKGDTGGMNYALILKGANEYTVEYAGSGNNIARIAGVLNRLDAELKRVQNKVEQLNSDLEFAKQEINKPFEKERELTEAVEKQKDITYRYEHFGETKDNTQTESAEQDNADTIQYSKQNADSTSDTDSRWTTERVESEKGGKKGKEKLIGISDIVSKISAKFGIPISTGKLTSATASAEYRKRVETIRTRIANNLPDISHELGHHIDKKYGLSDLDSIEKLREVVPQEFLEPYDDSEWNTESVGWFMEKYLQNSNNARRICPEFYADFVKALSKEDLKAVDEIADSVNEYMSYNLDDRYDASITNSKKQKKEDFSLKEKLHEIRENWVDPYLSIKDAVDFVQETTGQTLSGQKNAYTLATNSLNAHSVANFLVVEGFRDLNGKMVEDAKSFLECIAMVESDNIELLDKYLVLRHSLEWIAPTQEDVTAKRVFADDRLEDVAEIERRIAKIEKEHPEIKTAAENLYEYQNNILKHFLIPTGAITEDTLNTLKRKYPSYVPFYRAVGKEKSRKAKSTFANQKSPIKRAKGSGEQIISPLESIITNTEKMVKVAVRNQVADALGNYADTVDGFGKFIEPIAPDMIPHSINIKQIKDTFLDELTYISKSSEDYFAVSDLFETIFSDSVIDFTPIANANKKIVTVLRNGRPAYYQVHDDELYKSIAELTPQQLNGFKAVDWVMNRMKLLITQNNPIFAATNIMRDFGTAYKLSPTNNPVEFIARYFKALTGVVTSSDEYKQYKAMGGGHSSELTANIENISQILRKVAQKDMGKARRLAYAIFLHPVETAAILNDKTESIARFAEFQRTLESGGDLQEAIFNANDLTTNFRKQGAGTTAKVVNKLFLFNNAAIQGLDKTARTLSNKNIQQRNKTLMKFMLVALIGGIIQYLYNKKVDEEGYKNLSSYKKNNFYNFAIGDGEFISLPKPRENAILDSVTERAIEYMFGNDEAFYDFGSYLSSQLLPPMMPDDFSSLEGVTHSWLGSTVVGGLVDIGFNRDFKGTPIESKYDEYLPSNERYTENTSKIAYALGQTKFAREKNLSPKKIDHLISSYTGILGQANKALGSMNEERRDATIGLRNKFVSDSNYSTDLLNKAYDNTDVAKLQWQYDDNINNAIEYEQNSIITSYISGMNKAIKALPDDKQRVGRKYLLKTLNEWDYSLTTQQENMLSNLDGEAISEDVFFTELPGSEFTWTIDKQKYVYQMTPQEYNEYVSNYLKVVEEARKQFGDNSLESYEYAKTATKQYMSKYKEYLKGKYGSEGKLKKVGND